LSVLYSARAGTELPPAADRLVVVPARHPWRWVRLRQVDAAAHHQPPGEGRPRPRPGRRRVHRLPPGRQPPARAARAADSAAVPIDGK